ncbi:hypothetical protein QA635_32885 [Bradyrhizobium brasilense]|uniref:hypothetical protein n=1 Tax=Bradyrhizobium brasilense TaxID=1419277 RepID=UPI0024B05D12|nr:hypothetical protein [Bradyrhizobium australafricanum]WFU31320.1 hypothetical protein QA635_32885 [Bradyrhizobium australafricanum]
MRTRAALDNHLARAKWIIDGRVLVVGQPVAARSPDFVIEKKISPPDWTARSEHTGNQHMLAGQAAQGDLFVGNGQRS